MAEDQGHEHDEREQARRVETTVEQTGAGPENLMGQPETPSYPASLLSDPRMGGRGNGPVRAAVMRQAQSAYGNRALQRLVHKQNAAPKDGEAPAGEEAPVVAEPVQREADPKVEALDPQIADDAAAVGMTTREPPAEEPVASEPPKEKK